LVLSLGLWAYRGFLPRADALEDGFQSQLLYVASLLGGGALWDEMWRAPLVCVHFVRLIGVMPFVGPELLVWPKASLPVLLLAMWPLVRGRHQMNVSNRVLLALFLPLLVSGRGVLVAISVGYVILYLARVEKSKWFLWVGALFANLSSASVLVVILLLLFFRRGAAAQVRRDGVDQDWSRRLILLLLMLSFLASLVDKLHGFGGGEVGYEGYSSSSHNVLVAILSRSTLWVSVVEGQYLRAAAYSAIFSLFFVKLMSIMRRSGNEGARRLMLCCLPGIFMEGLGVWAMFFPLIWLALGWSGDIRNRLVKRKTFALRAE